MGRKNIRHRRTRYASPEPDPVSDDTALARPADPEALAALDARLREMKRPKGSTKIGASPVRKK